jgi:hypothetical protein
MMFIDERIKHLQEVRDRILLLKNEYHTLYWEGLDLAAGEIDTMIEEVNKIRPSGTPPAFVEHIQ